LTLTTKDDELKKKLKEVFTNPDNETELLKQKKAFLDDLVALVGLIDKAYTDGKNLEKSKIEAYSGTNASADRKKM